jgi:gliding motility-associated-like protein
MILTRPHGTLTAPDGVVVAPGTKIAREQIPTLSYMPDLDFNGIDTLRWTAADGFGLYPANTKGALLTITITPLNDLPDFTLEPETDTLKYELGSEIPIRLTRQFDSFDKDGDMITGAEIGFKRLDGYQFREENDRLIFPGYGNIIGTYSGGVLTLKGTASTTDYDSAIRRVQYNYVDAKEFLLDMRSVYIQISDGQSVSPQHARLIELIYTFEDLDIPAAFSPNEGDDVNKTWVITSPNGEGLYADAEIKVYNKNGLLLFHTRGLDNPWTGIYNGSVLPTDTYYYTIDLQYNKVRYKGTVTLVR